MSSVVRWVELVAVVGTLAAVPVRAQPPESREVAIPVGAPAGASGVAHQMRRIPLQERGLPGLVVELPRGWSLEVVDPVHQMGWVASPPSDTGAPVDRIVLWAVPFQICEQPIAPDEYVRVGSQSVPVRVESLGAQGLHARYCWWHSTGRVATALAVSVDASTDARLRQFLEVSTSYRPLDGSEVLLLSPAQQDELRQADLVRTVATVGALALAALMAGLVFGRRNWSGASLC